MLIMLAFVDKKKKIFCREIQRARASCRRWCSISEPNEVSV